MDGGGRREPPLVGPHGDSLDADRIEARYDHGVLTVSIPVAEAASPRGVEVTSGDGAAMAIAAESSETQAA